jgi:uncharacterized membrane protein HdeD (DUF308 family)
MAQNKSPVGALAVGLDKIHDSWGWFVALGIAFIVLGAVCIANDVTATMVSMLTLGWLLVIGAAVALVQSFRTREWSGFFLYFLTALPRGVAGYLLIRYTISGEVGVTMVLALLLLVGGMFRIIGASALRFPNWVWTANLGDPVICARGDAALPAAGYESLVHWLCDRGGLHYSTVPRSSRSAWQYARSLRGRDLARA